MLAALLSGGATGVLGSLLSHVVDIFKQRQENKHELELRKLDLQAMDKEYEFQREKSGDETLRASYEMDKAAYVNNQKLEGWGLHALTLVDVIRGLIRPALTCILLYVLWDTRCQLEQILDSVGMEHISVEQATELYSEMINSIIYIGTTAVLWWFGSRLKKR